MTSTIFIQIAAYRDPDLPATLHNLIQRAAHPERLRFGICLQLAEDDPSDWKGHFRSIHTQDRHIPGLKVAAPAGLVDRPRAERRRGFSAQIDSHMRAVEQWDDLPLTTWHVAINALSLASIPTDSNNRADCKHQHCRDGCRRFRRLRNPRFRGISQFHCQTNNLNAHPWSLHRRGSCSARAQSQRSALDPELYFDGEEVAMSARLWTSGFNIYEIVFCHLYKSEGTAGHSATHWGDHGNRFERNRRSPCGCTTS